MVAIFLGHDTLSKDWPTSEIGRKLLVKFWHLLMLLFLIFSGQLKAQPTYTVDPSDPFFWPLETLTTLQSENLHPFSFDPQRQRNWCWAATTATVLDILTDENVDPCEVAGEALGRNCCSNPTICNQQNNIPAMKSLLERNGYFISQEAGALSADTIMSDLSKGYPITVRVQSPYGNGHFINIVGFDLMKNGNRRRLYLKIHDPMHGYFEGGPSSLGYAIDYAKMRGGSLNGYRMSWTHSYRYFEIEDNEGEDGSNGGGANHDRGVIEEGDDDSGYVIID